MVKGNPTASVVKSNKTLGFPESLNIRNITVNFDMTA